MVVVVPFRELERCTPGTIKTSRPDSCGAGGLVQLEKQSKFRFSLDKQSKMRFKSPKRKQNLVQL